MRPFHYRNNQLSIGRLPLARLAARFGTPLYVYDFDAVTAAYRAYERAFARGAGPAPPLICAAVKANGSLALLRHLAALGSGFDVVSGGELARVLAAGGDPGRVVFSGVGKTADEMDAGLRAGILMFNVESAPELELLARRAARLRLRARYGVRVNPDIAAATHPHIATGLREHKFGVDLAQALRLYQRHRGGWLEPAGISCHIGSQILDAAPFEAAARRLAGLAAALERDGLRLDCLDVGGGLGIAYQPGQRPPSVAAFAAAVRRGLAAGSSHRPWRLVIEPGRSLVAAAGALLTRVLYLKPTPARRFVITDAGANDLLRPSLYNAYHAIVPLRRRPGRGREVDVVGPLCESGDCFAHGRRLPPLIVGDYLAILDTGAYGFALSSNYNARGRAAEVAVTGGQARLIRRRETVADLAATEILEQ